MCNASPSQSLKTPVTVRAQISNGTDLFLTITDTYLPGKLPRVVTGRFGTTEDWRVYPLCQPDGTKLDCVLNYQFDSNASTIYGEIWTTVANIMKICDFSVRKL